MAGYPRTRGLSTCTRFFPIYLPNTRHKPPTPLILTGIDVSTIFQFMPDVSYCVGMPRGGDANDCPGWRITRDPSHRVLAQAPPLHTTDRGKAII